MDWIGLAALVVAVIVAVPAFIALNKARQANTLANSALNQAYEANRLSKVANSLSEKANDYAHSQHAATFEVHDVSWDWEWTEVGVLKMTNQSTTCTAEAVSVRVERDGEERSRAQADAVGPGESVTLQLPGSVTVRAAEEAKLRRAQAPKPRNFLDGPELRTDWTVELEMSRHHVDWRVDWKTSLGTPKTESGSEMGPLAP